MWKVVENDEYEAASPAVQAHFHALRTEDALRREDFAVAEREGRLASDRFVQAAAGVASKRTVDALLLLAENYEYRAKVAQARMPQPAQEKTVVANRGGGGRGLQHAGGKDSAGGGKDRSSRETKDETPDDDTDSASTTTRGFARTYSKRSASTGADAHNPAASAAAETQLSLAAAEMEELWRKLQEIGLSSAGSADKVLHCIAVQTSVDRMWWWVVKLTMYVISTAEQRAHVVAPPVVVARRLVLPLTSQDKVQTPMLCAG